MRIICISDTHGHYPVLPEGDVLVHTGDYSPGRGSAEDTLNFYQWFGSQPHQHKLCVPGNHDIYDEASSNIHMQNIAANHGVLRLNDTSAIIDGVHFYGSPWSPSYGCGWAYNLPRNGLELKVKWGSIPSDTNVLLTHSPPHSVLDLTVRLESAGCEMLRRRVFGLPNLKLHVFGHIHESYGLSIKQLTGGWYTTFVNAALCDRRCKLQNDPIVVDL